MYESKISKLREIPVFSLSDLSQIVSGKDYAKKLLKRMIKSKEITKIERDKYSFYDDFFLTSAFLYKPSYISCVSALSYYKLITQIPKDIFCFTKRRTKKIEKACKIFYINTDYFFGFENLEYERFLIPIATPEKAVIDCIGIVPISLFEEAIEKLDKNKIVSYLKKIRKSSILKRAGFLLERNGIDVYKEIKRYINSKYIVLDSAAKKKGERNKKWRIIVNS